jgi:hypothetical protein
MALHFLKKEPELLFAVAFFVAVMVLVLQTIILKHFTIVVYDTDDSVITADEI